MAKQEFWKGLVAGSAAGLVGTVAMTQFQTLWGKASQKLSGRREEQSSGSESGSGEDGEDATMKTAGKLAEAAGYQLSYAQRKKAAPIVHYGFGAGMGAIYGSLVELGPRELRRHPLLSGIGFGSLLFAGADEVVVPAMGLAEQPEKMPLSSHLFALSSHVVYGLTAGAVRQALRAYL
jgi:hypothetical protein